MKPLIETVLAKLAWPEDAQLPADVKRITSGVSTLCQGVGALRTHYGSAHGTSTHLPPLDPAFAAFARNAGAAVAIFLLARHRDCGSRAMPEATAGAMRRSGTCACASSAPAG
ncbi:hypothetical protein DIE18_15835 [Burkholderia sp. Bp9125]|nr:hypothetical protein DIE18_15835 [Burkholderia sp. Bp9125]